MKAKKLIYTGTGIGILLLSVVLSGYLIRQKPTMQKDKKIHNAVFVKTDTVAYKTTEGDMSYRGRVTAFENISLAAEVQGKIMAGDVSFKPGESFRKGDVLINIYKEDVEASLKSGKSTFLQTLSRILPDLKVDFAQEYPKWDQFFNAIDMDGQLPELPEIESNKEKIFLASNNVLSAYYSLQQQEINLQRYTLIAPFNGSFKTVNKEIGAIASPGAELASIIRSDRLEITVPVFPADIQWINKGDKVLITNPRGEKRIATVSRIANFVDEATQSVNVYLNYQASGQTGFLQGEYVDINFGGATISGFEIPREALINGNSVYELYEERLETSEIEVLRQLNDSYIISGVDTGKVIVTESLASVNPDVRYLAR